MEDIIEELVISPAALAEVKQRIERLRESDSLLRVEHGEHRPVGETDTPEAIARCLDEKRLYDALRALDYEELVDVFALALWGEGLADCLEDAIDIAQDRLASCDADLAWFANSEACRGGFLSACSLLGLEQPFAGGKSCANAARRGFAAGVASAGAAALAVLAAFVAVRRRRRG